MNKPLFWNTLTESVAWLSEKLKRPISERELLDIVIKYGVICDENAGHDAPTVLSAVLPRNAEFAKITLGKPKLHGINVTDSEAEYMVNKYGELPKHHYYSGVDKPIVCPLPTNLLAEILLYGQASITKIYGRNVSRTGFESVWLMPYGAAHQTNIDAIGINKDDLTWLCNKLLELPKDSEFKHDELKQTLELTTSPNDDAGNTATKPNNKGTEIRWTDELIDAARTMKDELKASGANNPTVQTAAHYEVKPARLNKVFSEQKKRKAKQPNLEAFSATYKK